MVHRVLRRARKPRLCDSNFHPCVRRIFAGDRYLSIVLTPDHDGLGNRTWWRSAECEPCAVVGGRGGLFPARDETRAS